MDGLYYFDELDGITLFWFSPDGRVVAMFKSNLYDQHLITYPWFKLDSDIIHLSRGFYKIDIWDNIRICLKGDYGKIVYEGHIRDEYMDLYCRCPITNFKRLVTYVRLNEEHHIHLELGQSIIN
jgi:hypothetical protein